MFSWNSTYDNFCSLCLNYYVRYSVTLIRIKTCVTVGPRCVFGASCYMAFTYGRSVAYETYRKSWDTCCGGQYLHKHPPTHLPTQSTQSIQSIHLSTYLHIYLYLSVYPSRHLDTFQSSLDSLLSFYVTVAFHNFVFPWILFICILSAFFILCSSVCIVIVFSFGPVLNLYSFYRQNIICMIMQKKKVKLLVYVESFESYARGLGGCYLLTVIILRK
jgi:hypothetical protein